MGDEVVCKLHGSRKIVTGSLTVLVGGQPAARMGDLLDCPIIPPNAITQGFPMVLIGG
jgi:uncharacterized Zn-binding protein involved in type VI secretion